MDVQDRYSADTWPWEPLPALRLRAWPEADVGADGWIRVADRIGATPELVDCPAELHLREFAEIEVRSPQSMVDFVRQCGLPLNEHEPWAGVVSPRLLPHLRPRRYGQLVANVSQQLGYPIEALDQKRPEVPAVHVSEIALRASSIATLVKHLAAVLSGHPTQEVWQGAGALDFNAFELLPAEEDQKAEDWAWSHFTDMLNDALSPISPRVGGAHLGLPRVDDIADAFTAAASLIFNDLVEGMPYRRCADETCRRLFKSQLGRSTGVHSRRDAVYCTPQHARNQSQRERRRRERAAKRRTDDGE